jgi:hypothetical protein
MDANKRSVNEDNKTYPRPVYGIPPTQRSKILRSHGHGLKELREAQKNVTVARNRRKKTVQNLGRDDFHEKVENWLDMLTCKKEEVMEYPRRTLAAAVPEVSSSLRRLSYAVPEVSLSLRRLSYACRSCSVKALESNALTTMIRCQCDRKKMYPRAIARMENSGKTASSSVELTERETPIKSGLN